MPRYKLTIEYDGAPFAGWQIQADRPTVQGVLTAAIEALSGEKDHGAGRRAHRCRRARARPGGACRSRQGLGHRHRPRRAQRASAPASGGGAGGRAGGGRFQRAHLGDQAALPLSHRQPPRRSDARRRPRLARAAPARCRGDARGRAAPRRQARLHHLPLHRMPGQVAGEDARPLDVERDGDEVNVSASARSFLHNQVRSMVGSLVAGRRGQMERRRSRRARSPRATAPPAARWRRRTGFI